MPARRPPSPVESTWQTVAARRFYLDGATKSTIAEELGLSRFKVARLLEDAVRTGVVQIEVRSPTDVDVDLSLELAERFGLRQAVALRLPEDDDDSGRRDALARAAAAALGDLVEEGDVLGVSWGRTLHRMVDALPPLAAASVVQVVGTVPSPDLAVSSLELARAVAARSGAELHDLHAPMVVEDPETARLLRSEAQVRATTERFAGLTRAVVSIGSWSGTDSSLALALPADLRAEVAAAGAVADVCATVLDHRGEEVRVPGLAQRTVAITTEQLRAVPDVVAVVGGTGRGAAVAAALRSGLVHRVVLDDRTARAALDG